MSIVLTRTQNIRSQSNLDQNEIRGSRYGALDFALRDTEGPNSIITNDFKNRFFSSIGSTFQTPVINYNGGISIGSTRTATISDSEMTSDMVTIAASTYQWGFTMFPTLFHNNEIGYQQDFDAKFWSYAYLFLATLDTAVLTAINAAKTQIVGNPLIYSNAAGLITVGNAQELRVVGYMGPMMEANDFYRPLHIITESGGQSVISRLAQQGLYNAENKALQYQDKMIHITNRLTNDTDMSSTMYAITEGSVGIMSRVDREALARTRSKNKGYEWDVMNFPLLNLPVGTMYYEDDGDYNAIASTASADMTASHKQFFGFSVDIAIKTAYNSDITTRANPIMKFQIANT